MFALRSRLSATALVAPLLLCASGTAHAIYSLTFQGLVRSVNTGGSISLNMPSDVVVDTSGNVYFADTGNSRIVVVNPQGSASVLTVSGLSRAISGPTALALDRSGDLYVADTGNNRIVEISSSGAASVISTGSLILYGPQGIAVDLSGDIFVSDSGNNRIIEVTSSGTAAVLAIAVSSGSSALSYPLGLAVDASGTLFIADSSNSRIVKVATNSTTGTVLNIAGGVTLQAPSGVALDRTGNVYIADANTNRIAEVDTSGSGSVLYTSSVTLNAPVGVAVDVFGTVYIADTGDNRGLIANPPVVAGVAPGSATYSLNSSSVGFGHLQLGSATPVTLTLPFTIGSTALGSVQVLTAGVPNLDFTSGSSTTCSGSTGSNTSCSVQVSFLPTAPGLRTGAVVLYDGSGNALLTLPLYGFSDAPLAAFATNAGSVISTGSVVTQYPFQLALDGAGNMYVADYVQSSTNPKVVKVAAGGGSASAVSTSSVTLGSSITGIALDPAGNLFIADYYNERIVVVTPGGAASVLSISGLSPTLGEPTELAFDGAGNLFIADYSPNARVVRVSCLAVNGSTSSGLGQVIGTGSYTFSAASLTGVAVAPNGTISIASRTSNTSRVVQVTASGAASVLNTASLTLSDPQGVFADGMGNVYVDDSGNQRIVRVTSEGAVSAIGISGLTTPSTLASGFGVTTDAAGNLYIPDWTNNRIVYVNVSGTTLGFASTNVGSTSTDSPKTATVTNLGDEPLVFSAGPTFTADFGQNGADTNPCGASTILAIGTTCDISIKFTPQSAGSLSATIATTDNTLNVAGSTQQVTVSGIGINLGDTTATMISTTPPTAVYGQGVTIVAKVTDTQSGHTTSIPTGSVTFTDTFGSTISQLTSVTLDASGNAMLTGVLLTSVGGHTITASYAGVANTFIASNNTSAVTINTAPVTVTEPTAQPVQVTVGHAGSIVVSIAGAYNTLSAPSGSVSYSILNAANASVSSGAAPLVAGSGGSSATVPIPSTLAAGSYTVSVTYAGDANYQPNATAILIPLHIGQITPTIAWTAGGTIPYGTSLSGLLTATATNAGSGVPGAFAYTATPAGGVAGSVSAATVPGAGTYLITATFTPTDTTTYTTATATVNLVVSKSSVTASLASSVNPSIATGPVTFMAAATSSMSTPTGTMSFYDGTALLGSSTLVQGQAVFTTSSLGTGSHSITAAYSGDGNFSVATSTAVVQVVQDFTLSSTSSGSGATPSETVVPGGTATYALSLSPTAGTVFPAAVALSVSGLPAGATATISPQTIAAGSGQTPITLTIQVPASSARLGGGMGMTISALALLLLPFTRRMRRSGGRLPRLLVAVIFLIAGSSAAVAITGCGATNSGFFGQAEATYNVILTATSGTLSHSTTVILTVQ